ncbi:MAG TPA: YIP1 family protein, partial [Longimicrobiales bacterium]|nr:YIP1 family protein [Longimicrobiales bacterium]
TMVGVVWSIVLIVIGLREAHHTTTARAVLAVVIPIGLLLALVVVATMLVLLGIIVVGGVLPIG